MKDAAGAIEELCREADPASPIEHYVVCPICGQIFDCRDPVHIEHHSESLHDPLV